MDDLALEGASFLSAHYVPVYLKQSCWHKFIDDAKPIELRKWHIKSMYVFTITVDTMYYFQSATDWELEVWIH